MLQMSSISVATSSIQNSSLLSNSQESSSDRAEFAPIFLAFFQNDKQQTSSFGYLDTGSQINCVSSAHAEHFSSTKTPPLQVNTLSGHTTVTDARNIHIFRNGHHLKVSALVIPVAQGPFLPIFQLPEDVYKAASLHAEAWNSYISLPSSIPAGTQAAFLLSVSSMSSVMLDKFAHLPNNFFIFDSIFSVVVMGGTGTDRKSVV